MDPIIIVIIIGAIAIAAFVAIMVIGFIKTAKELNQSAKEIDISELSPFKETPDPDLTEEMPVVERHAKVIDMKCGTAVFAEQSYKKARFASQFLVIFEDDDGQKFDLFVPESLYLSLDVGNTGTLAFVDDRFFDYLADEESMES